MKGLFILGTLLLFMITTLLAKSVGVESNHDPIVKMNVVDRLQPKFPAKLRDNSLGCLACEAAFHGLMFYLKKNDSASEIEAALNKICDSLPESFSKPCHTMSHSIAKFLPLLPELAKRQNYDVKALCSMVQYCEIDCCTTPTEPEQIHLSFLNTTARGVTWSTLLPSCPEVSVRVLGDTTWTTISGKNDTYHRGGWIGQIMMVRLDETNLPRFSMDHTYEYRVGCESSGYSPLFRFQFEKFSRHLIIADMGNANSDATLSGLLDHRDEVDSIVCVGDESYADGYQAGWDNFLRRVQPLVAFVPFMTIPGNHEIGVVGQLGLAGYPYRFQLPYAQPWTSFPSPVLSNLHYGYSTHLIHWVTLDSESQLDLAMLTDYQVSWLDSYLSSIDRSVTPWVIVELHRPLYCTSPVRDCTSEAAYLRSRIESILNDHSVDLVLTGHRHNYERTFPVVNGTLVSDSYHNPSAPVYLVVGNAGNREGIAHFPSSAAPWSASRITEHGFGVLDVSPSSLSFQMIHSESKDVIDKFAITKS
mmetsp:Transcript_2390/g.3475  ORF Transcript_2390/g.3475 Transcript_2390/m.3475 type:complete len:531 (+) Transcript_2390:41-1633(+)